MTGLGFGTWPLGGCAYGPVGEADALDALAAAAEHGVTVFDCADIYGDGRAETLVGAAFAGDPSLTLVTKAGYLSEDGGAQRFDADHLRRALEASCRRLRRAAVDVFLLHSPPAALLAGDEVWAALAAIRASGLARITGVSLRTIDSLPAIAGRDDIGAVEVVLSLLDQRPIDAGLVAWAAGRGCRVLARVPLATGYLAGRGADVAALHPDDRRRRWPDAQRAAWAAAAARFRFLVRPDRTLAQAALGFLRQLPGVIPIPGMKSRAQVIANAAAVPALTDDELARVRAAWSELADLPPRVPG